MGVYTYLKLTDKGVALLTKVHAGATLDFTQYKLGSGTLTFPDDVPAMTALVNQEMTHPISEVKRVSDTQVVIKGYIEPADLPANGFDLTEIGIFADDPDDGEILFGLHYGTVPDNIPAASSGMAFDYAFNTAITVQDTDQVTVSVDAAAGATKQDLIDHEALQLDPTDTNADKKKHLSNAQAKKWEDHVDDDSGNPHNITPGMIGALKEGDYTVNRINEISGVITWADGLKLQYGYWTNDGLTETTIILHETFVNYALCAWANDIDAPNQTVTANILTTSTIYLQRSAGNPAKWFVLGY